jgi:hypothetical protein
MYLGASVKEYLGTNGVSTWGMSSDSYVKRAVADVEAELAKVGEYLKTKAKTPLPTGYRAELDTSPELSAEVANYYQGLIGVLRWMCELGRIDILVAVAHLSRFLAAPRKGHLEAAYSIFGYLKGHDRSSLVFDPTPFNFAKDRFASCDWSEFYPGAKEATPPNAPQFRGNAIEMSCYVDADHAGCHVTRRSQTGVLIFLNKAPIMWYSKKQNTVEASTFGSEFVAMRQAVEMIEGLRYKVRMLGIQIDGPTNTMGPTLVFCDNQSVVQNSTRPESVLKKKHNAIAYHRVREAIAAGTVQVAKEPTETNLADALTKLLPAPRLRELCGQFLH